MNMNNKSKTAVIVLSHRLLEIQKKELEESYNVKEIIVLPNNMLERWKNINPDGELDTGLINIINKFVLDNTKENDCVVVQGEWGMTVAIVNLCFKYNRIPIYSTTERMIRETIDNDEVKITRIFHHKQFRKYMN